ncbi:root meristem growth factor 10 [Ricinus communis]|uniref:Uncharacterized protein n=1 Tax=Ricinus communis TaxID=3988 RepID=B9RD74_RICCO|nr:root meristem growth factor 10 [Ricinus communis]EEF50332.1 conserved hypothetical protein [Ricinus communis]|eukprot:XP_002511663.1 uncharacterized protein LOC8265858 [Ricinus communis]
MSITSFLLLFLLCNSLHACNARPIPATTDNTNLDKKFNQNDEKKVSVAEKVESSASGIAKEDSIVQTHLLEDNNQTSKDSKAKNKKLMMAKEDIARKSSGSVQKESLVSVPWRVPHKKRGDKHPGFNLDYSPPKTHPPSHN